MGKSKRIKVSKNNSKVPLDQQIEESQTVKSKNRNKIRVTKDEDDEVC